MCKNNIFMCNNILKFSCQIIVFIWILSIFMVESSGIVIKPGVLCDQMACKCGYDLIICECVHQIKRIVIKPNEIRPGASNLTIINCDSVQFRSGAINNIGSLRTVNIHNVKRLELQEKSFQWAGDGMPPSTSRESIDFPRLSIHISNTNIPDISRYAFNGNIRKITMENVYIGKIQNFAFSSLNGMDKLEFKNTIVNNIQVQGFKKFTTNYIMIENSTFNTDLVSRTFSDIEVRAIFRISDNSHFKTIKPSAFILYKPLKVEVTDSTFEQLDGEAFKIRVLGDASFRDNYFRNLQSGAFVGITAERSPKLDFIFANNYLNDIQEHALNFNTTGFHVKFYTININVTCSCENIEKWTLMLYNSDTNAINCLNDNNKNVEDYINANYYSIKHCSASGRTFKTFIFVTTALIIIIVICVIVFMYLRSRYQNTHKKQWINNASPLAQRKLRNNSNASSTLKCINGKLPMVVPDGRTYRETVVVVESADLLTTDL